MEKFDRKTIKQLEELFSRLKQLMEKYPDRRSEILDKANKTLDRFERKVAVEELMDRKAIDLIDYSSTETSSQIKMRVKNAIIRMAGFEGKVSDFVTLIVNGGIQIKSKDLKTIFIGAFGIKEERAAYALIEILEATGLSSYIKGQLLGAEQ